jgi:hypothetical protein
MKTVQLHFKNGDVKHFDNAEMLCTGSWVVVQWFSSNESKQIAYPQSDLIMAESYFREE